MPTQPDCHDRRGPAGKPLLVTKSTVPVGTCQPLPARVHQLGRQDVVVVIWADDPEAALLMQELYAPFLAHGQSHDWDGYHLRRDDQGQRRASW